MRKIILKGMFFLICYWGVSLEVSAYGIECGAEYVVEVYGEGGVEVMPIVRVVDANTGQKIKDEDFFCDVMEGRIMFTFYKEGDYEMEISAIGYWSRYEYFGVDKAGEALGSVNVLRPVTLEQANFLVDLNVNIDLLGRNTLVCGQIVDRMQARKENIGVFIV